jgi:hypothetical protein
MPKPVPQETAGVPVGTCPWYSSEPSLAGFHKLSPVAKPEADRLDIVTQLLVSGFTIAVTVIASVCP